MQNTVSLPAIAIARLTAAIASLPGVRFVGVTYRSKSTKELARHTLILGASYANAVQASIDVLSGRENIGPDMTATKAMQETIASFPNGSDSKRAASAVLATFQGTIGPERAAAAELILSLFATLSALANGTENPAYTKAGLYETICPGLKVSRADGSFELCGFSHAKKVLEPGTYKTVNSSPKTLAKDELRETLPVSKFRTLALDVGALESVRIGKTEIDVAA